MPSLFAGIDPFVDPRPDKQHGGEPVSISQHETTVARTNLIRQRHTAMVDLVDTAMGVAATAVGAMFGWVWHQEKRVTVLETKQENVEKKLETMDQKLDRIVEHLIERG